MTVLEFLPSVISISCNAVVKNEKGILCPFCWGESFSGQNSGSLCDFRDEYGLSGRFDSDSNNSQFLFIVLADASSDLVTEGTFCSSCWGGLLGVLVVECVQSSVDFYFVTEGVSFLSLFELSWADWVISLFFSSFAVDIWSRPLFLDCVEFEGLFSLPSGAPVAGLETIPNESFC